MNSRQKKKSQHTVLPKLISQTVPFEYLEAFKSLRTNLQFTAINSENKKIIVTSSIPGEGKSTVCVNLAISMANLGKKVLLIDCDLRKPVVHKYLQLGNYQQSGLTNILTSMKKPEECILYLSDINLYVVTSGPVPPNPSEILSSKKMTDFIHSIESRFDYIFIDTPPVMVVTDAAVLSKLCDSVILVVRHKFSDYQTVQGAKAALEAVHANISGCVLNDFKANEDKQSYSYYHYKHYGYYGS